MAITVALIAVLLAIAGWWLSHQRLAAKPWLEAGAVDEFPATEASPLPAAKLGLGVFLAVAASLFALFTSAYFMRMHMGDWHHLPVPRLLWLNTGVLVASSAALQWAQVAARRGRLDGVKAGLLTGALTALLFLIGQLLAWRQLAAEGHFVASGPASSFFYLLTAVHGLHLLGGLVALGRTMGKVWRGSEPDEVRLSVGLCTTYWHFLLLVWVVMFATLLHS
jgi:cytochrome c oxidase subunit III